MTAVTLLGADSLETTLRSTDDVTIIRLHKSEKTLYFHVVRTVFVKFVKIVNFKGLSHFCVI